MSRDRILLVTLAFVLWLPFYYDLYHGQMMMTVLLLLTCTWLSLTSNREKFAGLSLGLLFALKLYAWPIALFLLLKKNCRAAVFWAIGTFALLNAVAIVWLGPDTFRQYFHVAQEIGSLYKTHPLNFSIVAQASQLAGVWAGSLIAVVTLGISLMLASRAPDFDHSFMIMIAVTIILGPVAWSHYMVTLLPAICLIASWKGVDMREKVLIAVLCYLAVPEIYESIFPLSLTRVMPVLFIFGLISLISRQLRKAPVVAEMRA